MSAGEAAVIATRILVCDPDPEGRRLIEEALASLGEGFRVTVRASLESCARELGRIPYDALLLGLPAPAPELLALLLACQKKEEPPLVFGIGPRQAPDDPLSDGPWPEKSAESLGPFVDSLPCRLRAQRIDRVGIRLEQVALGLNEAEALEEFAAHLVASLARLELRSVLVYIHPHTGRWGVLSASFRPELIQELRSVFPSETLTSSELSEGQARLRAALGEGASIYTEDLFALVDVYPGANAGRAREVVAHFKAPAVYLLPIAQDDTTRAVLVVCESLREPERAALDRLSGPLTSGVRHAQMLGQLTRQAAGLRALQHVSLIINATLDPEELLDQVLELLATVVPFDSACVMIRRGSELRIRAARGYEAFAGGAAVGSGLAIDRYPALRRMMITGRSARVPNTEKDAEWVSTSFSGHVQSWLGVPISRRGETIGLFSLDSLTAGFFHDFHVEIATAFARQVGVAMDNADLFVRERKASRQNRMLQELAGVINAMPDIQSILDHLARFAGEALAVSRAAVLLVSPFRDEVVAIALYDPGKSLVGDFLARSRLLPISLREERELRAAFQLDRARLYSARDLEPILPWIPPLRVKAVLVAPIQREGVLQGVLTLDEPGAEREFTEEERALAAALADHAAVAIHNVQAISELRRQSQELTSLFNLGIALSQELTSEGVVDLLFDQVDRLMEVDSAVLARLETSDSLHCDVLDKGHRLPAMDVPLRGPTLSGHVVRTGKPLLIRDYEAELERLPVPGLTAGVPTASWLGVPLIARGEVIGAVSIQSEAPNRFGESHLRLLRMIANQIAVAQDNARLLQTASLRTEELRLVNEIGRYAISVLDIQQLVREVAGRIQQAFAYYSVAILLVEGERLTPQAVALAPGGRSIQIDRTLSLHENSILTTVATTGSPWLVPDITVEPSYHPIPELPDARCELAVPLVIAGETVGVLDVQSDRAGGLGQADLELLQVLAAQVAISFANARLFAEVRAHAAQLEARVTARTAEIRSQKERTEAILRSVADAVVVLDLDGHLVLTNPVAQTHLAGPKSSEVLAQIGRLHAQGGVVSEQVELGELTFQALASPVKLGELAVGTVVVLRDISRLRELDRLKSQFVATVSHELRTPLANIKLYLSLLRKGREDRREQYLGVMDQETGRLGEMIEDLLNLSRLESRAVVEGTEPVELGPLLRQVVENHRPALQAKELRVEVIGGEGAFVPANRNQMIQVFTNLLSNAVNFTPEGGWVRIQVRGLTTLDGEERMAVAVEDGGRGIPDEDLPYIFDRFYRGSLARTHRIPGSGLGLAIVDEILKLHGGKVEVVSKLGEGSTFTVYLRTSASG
jgi:signal transduction histidine kinase